MQPWFSQLEVKLATCSSQWAGQMLVIQPLFRLSNHGMNPPSSCLIAHAVAEHRNGYLMQPHQLLYMALHWADVEATYM